MSRRTARGIDPAPGWTDVDRAEATARLRGVLGPAGDPGLERVVLMPIALSVYRATTGAEAARLPAWFWDGPRPDPFGGPLAILSETVAGPESTRPCHRPGRRPLDPGGRVWGPVDCGGCGPCLARAALERGR